MKLILTGADITRLYPSLGNILKPDEKYRLTGKYGAVEIRSMNGECIALAERK